jgi:hypothetical protein
VAARAAAGATPHDAIQRCVEPARVEDFTGLNLFAALPPIRIAIVEYLLLWRGFYLPGLVGVLLLTID